MMRFATLAMAGLFLVTLFAMAMWPEDARFGSPSQAVAVQEQHDGDPFGADAPQVTAAPGEGKPNPFAELPKATKSRPVPPLPKAAKSEPAPNSVNLSMRTQLNNRIRRVLEEPVDLVYDAELFGDMKGSLSGSLGVNIVVDANLEGLLDDDTEVSANLVGLPLSQSLRTVLRPLDATYVVKDGVLLIISIDDEWEPDYLSRRMFDVSDLLELIKDAESDRIGSDLTVGASEGDEGASALPPTKPTTAERLLIDAIGLVVTPDAWTFNGGGNSELTCVGGVLVVKSSDQSVEDVEGFLVDLKYQLKNQN